MVEHNVIQMPAKAKPMRHVKAKRRQALSARMLRRIKLQHGVAGLASSLRR
jgi:hypothetical protein